MVESSDDQRQAGWSIGQRVVDEEVNRATVRYIGPVATAKDQTALYIGVEWDDPTRGKHDGSVVKDDGTVVRHFSCVRSSGPTCASFLKPPKLDRGVEFMSTLHIRYVGLDAPLEAPNNQFEGAYANTSRGGHKQIEFHGEMKIRHYQQLPILETVSMRGERVAFSGDAVGEEAAHLVEVDLQGNLWWSWEELGRLARQLPKIEVLHLNSNMMVPLTSLASQGLRSFFPRLRTLVLNNCGIASWSSVANLEPCVPSLKELAVACNQLEDIEDVTQGKPVDGFGLLERLDLSGTGLTRWSQVDLFAQLPHLLSLSLNENHLDAIEPPSPDTNAFTHLESLHISANRISAWSSIDSINCFPALVSLRFTSNPVTKGLGQSEARQLIVARVARLTRLNGAEVTKRERAEADKSYLRRVARDLTKLETGDEGAKAALLSQHPRYAELRQTYGDMGPVGGGGDGAKSLASELLSVKLMSMAAGSATIEPVEKRLPGSMTVGRLKQMLSKLFKLDPPLQVLYYKAEKGAPPTMLDEDSETLSYFGVTSGCEVYMNELDVKQKAREEEERKRQEQERMEEEMRRIDIMSNLKRQQVNLDTQSVQRAAGALV